MTSSYRDLRIWQRAMDVAVRIYAITKRFPKEETFGLAQQLKRAAVSISSNIAEGYGRKTHRQTYHFLENALGYLDDEIVDLLKDVKEIGKGHQRLDALRRT